ncbi:putative RNA-binding S4 domain-containing protein [Helianthus annuus]|nr:putative RNA-binding S4 domain-containing protein [Helianthus annuus]
MISPGTNKISGVSRARVKSSIKEGLVSVNHRVVIKLAEIKKQTVFILQTGEVWSTSSATDVCRCGPQTADVLPLKKQTTPDSSQHPFLINFPVF